MDLCKSSDVEEERPDILELEIVRDSAHWIDLDEINNTQSCIYAISINSYYCLASQTLTPHRLFYIWINTQRAGLAHCLYSFGSPRQDCVTNQIEA